MLVAMVAVAALATLAFPSGLAADDAMTSGGNDAMMSKVSDAAMSKGTEVAPRICKV